MKATVLTILILSIANNSWSETIDYKNGSKYVGEVRDNLPNGHGVYTQRPENEFIEGDMYIGKWKDGYMHGQGTYTDYYNGGSSEYIGRWSKSRKHGIGIQTYSDGRVFKGYWENNILKIGRYTYTTKYNPFNLGVYVGEFNKYKHFHGQGVLTHANGTVQEGVWENNMFKGEKEYKYLVDCLFSDGENTSFLYWQKCK